ncbi:TetR/AcrR family transcriptional regulator [Desulfurivibrio sp. D14AmB]|uniref:TetR/AcrR family transcriptional regulator n=1 Tax=Desulfurivibrio sp. D14AmB TaxID=3374370 RepID=UPI00376EC3F3
MKNSGQKHLPGEQRRELTVATVIELAGEQNPEEITTGAIAERMQLTQGALFRHFPSKEAIWQAVLEWVARQLSRRVEKAAWQAASPLAALEAVFNTHIDFVVQHPGVPRMLFGQLQKAGDTAAKQVVRSLLARYGEHLQEIIEAGKERGEIAAAIDGTAAASLFIGSIQGLVMQSLLLDDFTHVRRQAPAVFLLFRRGIMA